MATGIATKADTRIDAEKAREKAALSFEERFTSKSLQIDERQIVEMGRTKCSVRPRRYVWR